MRRDSSSRTSARLRWAWEVRDPVRGPCGGAAQQRGVACVAVLVLLRVVPAAQLLGPGDFVVGLG